MEYGYLILISGYQDESVWIRGETGVNSGADSCEIIKVWLIMV